MKKWFISDTHFSYANIIKYAGRPFANVDEMNQTLIDNWNSFVGVDDQVFFSWGLWTWKYRSSLLFLVLSIFSKTLE